MQPIFLIATIAAAVALGIGYMANDISLDGMVQEFGVGESTLEAPTESVNIVAKIVRTGTFIGSIPNFKDIIVECLFSSPDTIEKGSMLFCKLMDQRGDAETVGNVLAEGMKTTGTVPPNLTVTIPVTFFAFQNSNNANIVHDLYVIVKGPPH